MKKRLLSATLAAILAAASMSTAVFADQTTTSNTDSTTQDVAADGTLTTAVAANTSVPDIKVTLPATITYVANPYKLTVKVNNEDKKDTVISPDIVITNSGVGKIAVTATVNATASTGVIIVDGVNKAADATKAYTVDTKTTDKTIQLFLEPGTEKSGKVTYSGKYAAKTCEMAYKAGTAATTITDAKATAQGENALLTLQPIKQEVSTTETMGVVADVGTLTASDLGLTGDTIYVKSIVESDEETNSQGKITAAVEEYKNADSADKATKKAAIAALVTTTEADAIQTAKITYTPTVGYIKISGDMNTNAEWTSEDEVSLSIAWKIKRLVNDAK